MPEPNRCPECGTELPSDSPTGHCPACLLKLGVEGDPSQPEIGATIDSPAPGSPPGGFAPPSIAELAERFPQFEIIELLGKGGMGAVYKARQPKLDRYVALKILPPHLGNDAAFAERFAREAQALAKLNHPNIVTVYDFGDIDGLYYFAMEFVDGVNLRQSIRSKKLTADEALAIVPQICDALQFAHEEGIVHRDIKPENVLLDKRGRVKIADFGLAKLLGRSTAAGQLTISHQVMGTMHYMAPEQMKNPLQVDHRADIYSLGVVFYELLTGELPLGRFAPPSEKAPVNAELDRVVLRTLEVEPDHRYQHVSEVKTDVDRVSRLDNAGLRTADSPAPTAQLISAPAALTLDGKAIGSGVVRFDGSQVTLEFELSEDDAAWFAGSTPHYPKPCKPGLHEVVIPLGAIASAEFKQGWFGGQVRIKAHTVQAVTDVPGSDQVTVVLAITKENAGLGAQLVAAIKRSLGREASPRVDDADLEDARRQVKGPAAGLIVAGVLNLLPAVLVLVGFVVSLFAWQAQRSEGDSGRVSLALAQPNAVILGQARPRFTPEPLVGMLAPAPGPTELIIIALTMGLFLPAGIVMLIGGIKMRRLKSYGLAMTASILAVIPGVSCIVGLPFGIWSLVVLLRPEVKAAFGRGMPRSASVEAKPPSEADRLRVQRMLNGPAIGLFIVALVSLLPFIMAIIVFLYRSLFVSHGG